MKKHLVVLALLGLLLTLAACGPSSPDPTAEPTDSPAVATSEPTPLPPPATATTEAYPPPPTAPPISEDYPGPPTAAPPSDAYPGGRAVWVLRALGTQCVDASEYEYADLEAATDALREAGVAVLAAEQTELMVCTACDCPTSEHFRVQIRDGDLSTAQELGWSEESG